MPTMIRGGYPDIAYFVPDNDNPQNRMAFICRIENEAGLYVNEPINGLIGMGASELILRTPVKLELGLGASSIIFEDYFYSIISINKRIPDNRTRGFVKSEVFAEYIIVAGNK